MYGDYAHRQRLKQAMAEHREQIRTDPEYRKEFIEKLGLEEIFSQMTEEHWKIADAKYGYKRDRT